MSIVASMKILIHQDMEGVAGVVKGGYGAARGSEEELHSRRMMTREVSAAVRGILQAAPDAEIVAWEAHPYLLDELHPAAKIARGVQHLELMTLGFDALYWVGQHARTGLRQAVLSHTGSSKSILGVWVNDRPFGEIGLFGALAGEHGIPSVFLSGDSAAVGEAAEFFGDIVTVETMEALGNHAAICLSNARSCELIEAAAAEAVGTIGQVAPFQVPGPVECRIEYRFAEIADVHCLIPGVERVNDRTIAYRADSYIEAFRGGYIGASLVLPRYDW